MGAWRRRLAQAAAGAARPRLAVVGATQVALLLSKNGAWSWCLELVPRVRVADEGAAPELLPESPPPSRRRRCASAGADAGATMWARQAWRRPVTRSAAAPAAPVQARTGPGHQGARLARRGWALRAQAARTASGLRVCPGARGANRRAGCKQIVAGRDRTRRALSPHARMSPPGAGRVWIRVPHHTEIQLAGEDVIAGVVFRCGGLLAESGAVYETGWWRRDGSWT